MEKGVITGLPIYVVLVIKNRNDQYLLQLRSDTMEYTPLLKAITGLTAELTAAVKGEVYNIVDDFLNMDSDESPIDAIDLLGRVIIRATVTLPDSTWEKLHAANSADDPYATLIFATEQEILAGRSNPGHLIHSIAKWVLGGL